MITSVTKIKIDTYIINETVTLKINNDSSLEVSFDNEIMSQDETTELISEFFELIDKG